MEIVYHGKWLWDSPYDGDPEFEYTEEQIEMLEEMRADREEDRINEEEERYYGCFS